jgi:condensin complex subunit 1
MVQINGLQPPSDAPGLAEEDTAMELSKEDTKDPDAEAEEKAPENEAPANDAATGEDLMKLQLTKRYYTEALKFIESLHEASEVIQQLLASKNKSEVLESMDFFVMADAYKLATAKVCVI